MNWDVNDEDDEPVFDHGSVKIIWDADPPEGVEQKVREDITKELDGLKRASDLIFHHVFLTKDMNGPSVHLTGDTKLNCFRATYSEQTVWKPLSELPKE